MSGDFRKVHLLHFRDDCHELPDLDLPVGSDSSYCCSYSLPLNRAYRPTAGCHQRNVGDPPTASCHEESAVQCTIGLHTEADDDLDSSRAASKLPPE